MDEALVPIQQVLARYRIEGCIFNRPGKWTICAISQLQSFPPRDARRVLIPARDSGGDESLRQHDLFAAEFRFAQKLQDDVKNVIEIIFQARPPDGRGIETSASLYFRRAGFQIIVKLVSGSRS